jgi:hypothetical protein
MGLVDPAFHFQRRGDFRPLSRISIRSAATVIRSMMFWTRLFTSIGGMASHCSESFDAQRRAASNARASRSSGASESTTSIFDARLNRPALYMPADSLGDLILSPIFFFRSSNSLALSIMP